MKAIKKIIIIYEDGSTVEIPSKELQVIPKKDMAAAIILGSLIGLGEYILYSKEVKK